MKPDARRRRPDPRYLRDLIKAAELTQAEAAALVGVSARSMRCYLSTDPAAGTPAPYAVQYALERLARP